MKNPSYQVKTVKVTKTMPLGAGEKEETEKMSVEAAREEYKKWLSYGFTVGYKEAHSVELIAGTPYNTIRSIRFDY